jgi:hypothetical protein
LPRTYPIEINNSLQVWPGYIIVSAFKTPFQNGGYSDPGAAGKLNEVLPRVTAIHD